MASGHGEIVTRVGQALQSMKMESLKTFKGVFGGYSDHSVCVWLYQIGHFATWPKPLNQQDSSIPRGGGGWSLCDKIADTMMS